MSIGNDTEINDNVWQAMLVSFAKALDMIRESSKGPRGMCGSNLMYPQYMGRGALLN